jgi:predicted ATPase
MTVNWLEARHFVRSIVLSRERVPSFSQYPFSLPAVRTLDTLEFHPNVTFLIGENGSGKSTLLEALAVDLRLNAEGGSRNFNFSSRASHSPLCDFIQVKKGLRRPSDCWFLRAESFFNVATEIERLDAGSPATGWNPAILPAYGEVSLHEQSHGEAFFSLFQNRFRGDGLYLLDEPEAALSPTRQLAFLSLMHKLVREGAQFIIATHSPIIMAYPQAWIYCCETAGLRRTEYKDTEHYKVSQAFLARPEKMLSVLLEDIGDTK